ncbi:uncharacterized protein LOC123682595 [Harmonia axyridis]|uniref:uncharacterized protein LOC123682595 n=1 Tax=Harmonia axyridis TaxID=115357 RepID=UPI001E278F0F|nr:uncharacterized protein LOC123682595 [Harmonia axyridis]
MSTLTRRSSGNRVPDYKDYMTFVSAYRNGKRDPEAGDDQTFILPTNDSKKMVPEVSGFSAGKVCDSYSSFLEKTKTKKFSSVKPPSVILTPNEPANKQTVKVKTEIFLEINNEETPKKLEFTVVDKNVECTDEDTIASGQVEARKKMFEGRTQQENKIPTVTNGNQQKNKILTLKRKLESNNAKPTETNPTVAPIETINKIHSKTENPTQTTVTDGVQAQEILNFHLIEKRNNEQQADVSSKDRLIDQLNEALKFKTSLTLETDIKKETEDTKVELTTENICVKNIPKEFSSIPPPPPPMPNGLRKTPPTYRMNKENNDNREKNNKSPPFNANNETDTEISKKNQKSSTLERTNPLVRKLAYGAMLDMYGAYHEKANSYVSTLPRQHVRKDNGLQKIIDSIAAQGGLDKLSGRSNPKAENE